MRFRTATVTALLEQRPGLQRVDTTLGRAYALTDHTGPLDVGDEVVLNTTAVDLALGTGGWHVVHWNLARREWDGPSDGHIMKLRYTSLQGNCDPAEVATGTAPVVACGLHSQVPCVAAAFKHARPDGRVTYVMTDGAALPLALSDLVVAMKERRLVDETVTAGHAFGGDREAVTVAAALGADADLVVVAMGPGVVGTGTRLGTTAIEVASVLDTAAALGQRAIACLRYSDADPRDRHRGLSHHTRTALELTRSTVEVAVPQGIELELGRHTVTIVPDVDVPTLLGDLRVTSMGRGPEDDPAFFAVAGAAGTLASLGT